MTLTEEIAAAAAAAAVLRHLSRDVASQYRLQTTRIRLG